MYVYTKSNCDFFLSHRFDSKVSSFGEILSSPLTHHTFTSHSTDPLILDTPTRVFLWLPSSYLDRVNPEQQKSALEIAEVSLFVCLSVCQSPFLPVNLTPLYLLCTAFCYTAVLPQVDPNHHGNPGGGRTGPFVPLSLMATPLSPAGPSGEGSPATNFQGSQLYLPCHWTDKGRSRTCSRIWDETGLLLLDELYRSSAQAAMLVQIALITDEILTCK